MVKKSKRSLVALNILVGFLALLLFVGSRVISTLKVPYDDSYVSQYDGRLSRQIGQQYTHSMHDQIVGSIKAGDRATMSAFKLIHSSGRLGTIIGIFLLILPSISIWILLRGKKNKPNQ